MGPLKGVTVLDLTRVLAGPWATQTLADLGAEVIKIERPGAGDDTRAWGPPFLDGDDEAGAHGDAAYFTSANRNKRSVTANLATEEGRDIVRALAMQADILVENFKVGGLGRHGLDYASLAKLNPRLIYCSVTGFGQTGPEASRAGYDAMIQAMGGLMSITGQPAGAPGDEPMKTGVAVVDLFTGMYAATAILAALLHVRATGQGQHIDLALFDVQLSMLANQASNYLVSGRSPGRLGNAHPNLVPYQVFETADGALVLAIGNDAQFRAFAALCSDALATDPRFQTNALRVGNRVELVDVLRPHLRRRTTAEWAGLLDGAGVPCGPINSVAQAFAEPQAIARGAVVEQARDDLQAPIRTVASPIRLSETPLEYRLAPPALGADTRAVLGERLGLPEDALDRLASSGAI
ncbi:MAG: CoA transferase [Caulobacter sp.]|nr:CoA transferase [Caulobacter sp.]